MNGKCDWKRCRRPAVMGYLGRELCERCHGEFCKWQLLGHEDRARAMIGLPPVKTKAEVTK